MKKLILVCGLWLAVRGWVNAQYTPIPESGVVWREYSWMGNSLDGGYTTYRQLFEDGDTIITGKKYIKLFETGYQYVNEIHSPNGVFGIPVRPEGFFRNDTAARKAYYLKNGNPTEYLLYDFNLKVGDTIPALQFGGGGYVIAAIDTVQMFGHSLKRWKFSDPGFFAEMAIIESVGSVSGFVSSLIVGVMGVENRLECYSLHDTAYDVYGIFPSLAPPVPVYSGNTCWLYSDITETTNGFPFSLTPNPASSFLTISINAEHTGSTIALTDLTGRVVLQSEIENPKSEISIASLPSGIYLAVLATPSGQRAVRKVVKE